MAARKRENKEERRRERENRERKNEKIRGRKTEEKDRQRHYREREVEKKKGRLKYDVFIDSMSSVIMFKAYRFLAADSAATLL